MQTLGLSDSTPRTESRLKSLFWPSIQNGTDVDYLGAQGYWFCAFVAVMTFVFTAIQGHWISGVFVFLFYYLGGVGVRERSRYAALVVLIMSVVDMLVAGPGVFRVLVAALLLSNLRATCVASVWKPGSEEAILPPRLGDNLTDKLADKLPMWLWPKVRIPYYVFSVVFLFLVAAGLAVMMLHWTRLA